MSRFSHSVYAAPVGILVHGQFQFFHYRVLITMVSAAYWKNLGNARSHVKVTLTCGVMTAPGDLYTPLAVALKCCLGTSYFRGVEP